MQEPCFIPRPNAKAEDDGWVLVSVYNAATLKNEIAILNAQRWAAPNRDKHTVQ